MDLGRVRSAMLVLRTMREDGGTSTAPALCERLGLSRSALDRGLGDLIRCGLVQRGERKFGVPSILALTAIGTQAARHADILAVLLSIEGPSDAASTVRER